MYIDMECVLLMNSAQPYFSFKHLGERVRDVRGKIRRPSDCACLQRGLTGARCMEASAHGGSQETSIILLLPQAVAVGHVR